LRLILTLLQKNRPLLLLDETFAQLSVDFEAGMGLFLREVVDKTGVQILLVTHSPQFSEFADRVYRFSQKDGKTLVAEADTPHA